MAFRRLLDPRTVVVVVVLAIVATLGWMALRSPGYAKHRADLNDGVIWVSNSQAALFGRFNKPIQEIDGAARVPTSGTPDYDVVQQGAAVIGLDRAASTMYAIDVASGAVADGASARLAPTSTVVLNGGTAAVIDKASGKLWVTAADESGVPSIGDLSSDAKAPATPGRESGMTVTSDGSVVVASKENSELSRFRFANGKLAKPTTSTLDLTGTPELTAVGNTVVVLDSASGQLSVEGKDLAVVPRGSRLQQVGPSATSVLVTTPTSLLQIDLSSGEAISLVSGSGTPTTAVRLGDCAYGAWAGSPKGAVATVCSDGVPRGGPVGPAATLQLRTNRGEVVLNDRATGAVWNIDSSDPQRVDNWEGFKPTEKDDSDTRNEVKDDDPANRPPKAAPDTLGARPGATTVLHVLDNDQSPTGTLLAIRAVDEPSPEGADVRISPDAQTLLLTVPDGTSGTNIRFGYTVDAGGRKTANANVHVAVAGPASQTPPTLRTDAAAQRPQYTVPSRGSVTLPVIGDWRDRTEGDAVALTSAKASIGKADVTADGRIRFSAPLEGGQASIKYTVTDTAGSEAEDELRVTVQKASAFNAVAPKAQPDVANGVVGEAVVLRPLDNDIPGSDPLNPSAQLVLAAPVGGSGGLRVETNQDVGKVTVVPSRPGSYTLSYQAGFGDAASSTGMVRLDVRVPRDADAPIAVPDSTTLNGNAPRILDVLANDFDPRGRVLSVEKAELLGGPEPINLTVIDGHWVRLQVTAQLSRNPLTVRYTITNGSKGGVPGDITVRQGPVITNDEPVTVDDHATVRAGSAVAVPVLDNDFTPSGEPVSLAVGPGTEPTVEPQEMGTALVSGRMLRFVAPQSVQNATVVDVAYTVTTAAGLQRPGTAHITVVPAPSKANPNQVPTPPTLEGRVGAGGQLSLKVPSGGSDPDGDAITVTGIGSAPRLGRIIGFGATELKYEAFPRATGGETFTYQVTDPYGGVARGTVRIAVTAPAMPQTPAAADDVLTAAPGRTVTVPVTSNDYIDPSDDVVVEKLELSNPDGLPEGAKLVTPTGPVELVAGPDDGRPASLVYALTNGRDTPSTATFTVRSQTGFNNPPVVFDAYGTLKDQGATATVDLFKRAYDPDGKAKDLRVDRVHTAPGVTEAKISGGKVTLTLTDQTQVVPYEVVDKDGGRATAMIYLPAVGAGLPFLADTSQIKLPQGGQLDLAVNDRVIDPAGQPVRLTLKDTIVGAPATDLRVTAKGDQTVRLKALGTYQGPASVTFEVATSKNLAGAVRNTITIPVLIGDPEPVLRCTESPIDLVEGGLAVTVDVPALCRVWTPDGVAADSLNYSAVVSEGLGGVEVGSAAGRPTLQAGGGSAAQGQTGRIEVSVDGTSATAQLAVRITKAGPPSLSPVTLAGVKAGETKTIDLAGNFRSPLADARPRVLSIEKISGPTAEASVQGTTVQVTPEEFGVVVWRVAMTDVAGEPGAERIVQTTITLDVLDKPGQPGAPASAGVQDSQVSLSWQPATPNGAPVTKYEVSWNGGTQNCGAATSCVIRRLTNGTDHTFTVTATNAVGTGEPSQSSKPITPDAIPTRVQSLATVGEPTDHTVRIRWQTPAKQTTVDGYYVSYEGKRLPVRGTETTLKLKSNNVPAQVSIFAFNTLGTGPGSTIRVQSSGKPAAPAPVTTVIADGADGTAKLTVNWSHGGEQWEGKAGTYTVYRNGAVLKAGLSAGTHQIIDTVAYDGTSYVYAVTATNSTGGASHTSVRGSASALKATGIPDTPVFSASEATGNDTMGRYSFSVGEIRGTGATYTLTTAKGAFTGPISRNGAVADLVKPTAENGSTSVPTLKVCNAQGQCSGMVSGVGVRPYGPLSSNGISNVGSGASGTRTSFSATIDTNGRPATVTVTGNRGYSGTWTVDSRGQGISDSHEVGYSTNETFTVRITDGSRGSGERQTTSPTTDAPPPKVSVYRGAAYSGSGCNNCYFVGVTTQDFQSNVTCSVRAKLSNGTEANGGFVTWSQGGNQSKQSPNYSGYPQIRAECSGSNGTATSGWVSWP